MSAHKRGNNWYVNFRFARVRYRKRSPDNSRAGAQAYETVLRQKLAKGEPLKDKPVELVPTFGEFSDEWMASYVETNNKWSEIVSKRNILKVNLLPFFGNMRLDQITSRCIEEYKALKMKTGLKNKSVNNHLSCLRKCLHTAQEWEIICHVPRIKLLKVPPPETVYLTPEECDKLLSKADGILHDMIFTILRTGLRFGELIALMWTDIDFERKILTVQRGIAKGRMGSTKGNKIRKIPLAADLLEMFAFRIRRSEYVFTDEKGQLLKQMPFCDRIRSLAKKAGIRRIGWHTLRHTFASQLANNGIAIQVIQALLGHSDIKTTMRYAHIAPATLVDAINVLQNTSGQFWTQGGHKNAFLPLPQNISTPALVKILP
jgi:integrase